jgi:isoquinoline 1-oxidoreductase subunit alpha
MPTLSLNVNKKAYTANVSSADMPLLWVLRDVLGLTGTKYGCGIEVCGACTVLLNGEPKRSCVINASEAVGRTVITVEGLAADADGAKAQKAWVDNQVPQCGYCQPGMLMACVGAMKAGHHGNEISPEIGNVCACGTFPRIKVAIKAL